MASQLELPWHTGSGRVRKQRALDHHEQARADVLRTLRAHLKQLFLDRVVNHGASAYVTADDAARIYNTLVERGELLPLPSRAFLGQVFRAGGWTLLSKDTIKSTQPRNHHRELKLWRLP